MKYERLTNGYVVNGYVCNGNEETNLCDGDCVAVWNRLQELEDKIEDGTLVELPKPYIDETDYKDCGTRYEVWHSRVETHCSYEDDTFNTKEAAEARLKELRGEK